MSILDAIYKQSESVVDSLDSMSASLERMQKQDTQEYKREETHRKSQKEFNKRRRQDNARVSDTIKRAVVGKKEDSKKAEEDLGNGVLAMGIAAIIARAVSKFTKSAAQVSPGGGGGDGGGGDEGGGGGPAPTPGTIDPGEAGTVRGAVSLSSLITAFIPGVRQIQEGAEIVTDLAAGDVVGAMLSGLSLLPFPAGTAASLIDSAWHMFIKSDEQRMKENEQFANILNQIPGIVKVDEVLEAFKDLRTSVGFQSGGFAGMVPDLGQPKTGDHFYTNVDPGSFVLNRNAVAALGFQGGGRVPVALEQGEMVFSPGTFDAHMMELVNSSIPRFQIGGLVEHLHGDPSRAGYDLAGHGTQANAHDHFAFSDKETTVAVMKRLKEMGYTVTRFGVKNGHSPNSYHYRDQAFDVPWSQFGSGAIGQSDYEKSRKLKADVTKILRDLGGDTSTSIAQQPTGERKDDQQPIPGMGERYSEEEEETGTGSGIFGMLAGAGKFGAAASGLLKQIDEGLGLSEYGLDIGSLMFGGSMFGGAAMAANTPGSRAGDNITAARGEASGDAVAGAKLIMQQGVPKVGAAYLAGNIQQESAWNGQRSWGEVMGDGSDRNGGLVSWMDGVAHNNFRLTKIENYLGKNIKAASDVEQIKAMLWEMKNDYPGAYQTFMNTNASQGDLIAASKAYWGYGHEGPRYQYAEQIRKGLKKGGLVNFQKGGMVGALSNHIKKDLINFFEQSNIQNQYIANSGEPNIVMMDGGDQEVGSVTSIDTGNNLPEGNIPPRDNCPLSMYYIFNPSFNPIGIGVT